MEIECPECEKTQELDWDDLPERACDDEDYECRYCEYQFKIGWYATAELR